MFKPVEKVLFAALFTLAGILESMMDKLRPGIRQD